MSFPFDVHSATASDSHLPCHAHAMLRPCRSCQGHSRAWHGRDMVSVNQTRPHCVNQMGKTHSKPLAVRRGRGKAWARHGHGMLCVNRPLYGYPVTAPLSSQQMPHGTSCDGTQVTVLRSRRLTARPPSRIILNFMFSHRIKWKCELWQTVICDYKNL